MGIMKMRERIYDRTVTGPHPADRYFRRRGWWLLVLGAVLALAMVLTILFDTIPVEPYAVPLGVGIILLFVLLGVLSFRKAQRMPEGAMVREVKWIGSGLPIEIDYPAGEDPGSDDSFPRR